MENENQYFRHISLCYYGNGNAVQPRKEFAAVYREDVVVGHQCQN